MYIILHILNFYPPKFAKNQIFLGDYAHVKVVSIYLYIP